MAELINKKDAIEQIKSIPYATQEEILCKHVAADRIRRLPTTTEAEIRAMAEHTYENCHNITCRRKCQKDGYNMAIDEFAEKFIYKVHCEGCSGCTNCYETGTQDNCDTYRYFAEVAEELKAEQLKEE